MHFGGTEEAYINTIVLSLTAAILVFYTSETYKLRKEAEKQTDLEIRPYLKVRYETESNSLIIMNIGRHVAREIKFKYLEEDIVIQSLFDPDNSSHITLADGTSVEAILPIRFTYKDLKNNPYEAKFEYDKLYGGLIKEKYQNLL